MGDNENSQSGGALQNNVVYAFAVGDKLIGSFVRTGEPMNRTYHVSNGDGEEIGHVTRYRYVEAILMVLLRDAMIDTVVEEVEAPKLIADLEKFLANPMEGSDG
jgi:hypothetical protein